MSPEPLPPSSRREVPALHSSNFSPQQLINPQGSKTVPHIPEGMPGFVFPAFGKPAPAEKSPKRMMESPPETPFLLPSGVLDTLIPPDNLGRDQGTQHRCLQQPQTKTSLRSVRNTLSTSKNPAQSLQSSRAEGQRKKSGEAGDQKGFA